eukprot:TRINITY_DN2735_c0_g2_i4.p1 TRINITY_DN2735_c0_g2~~TRINITY_DN2735_c0_g2_i4.p1  ORF type:complete len:274 (+),score=54.42 TRINITY_DN2735_c0_g2_i4:210-1031(+)
MAALTPSPRTRGIQHVRRPPVSIRRTGRSFSVYDQETSPRKPLQRRRLSYAPLSASPSKLPSPRVDAQSVRLDSVSPYQPRSPRLKPAGRTPRRTHESTTSSPTKKSAFKQQLQTSLTDLNAFGCRAQATADAVDAVLDGLQEPCERGSAWTAQRWIEEHFADLHSLLDQRKHVLLSAVEGSRSRKCAALKQQQQQLQVVQEAVTNARRGAEVLLGGKPEDAQLEEGVTALHAVLGSSVGAEPVEEASIAVNFGEDFVSQVMVHGHVGDGQGE